MCLIFRNARERTKKILWKDIFLSLGDMKNMMEINIKENAKENIVIFSLLLSLKISEENKREREGESWRKFYQAHIIFFIESPIQLTSSSLVAMASHHHLSFQQLPPYSNHLPIPPKTNPLQVHKFPWMNCILQI